MDPRRLAMALVPGLALLLAFQVAAQPVRVKGTPIGGPAAAQPVQEKRAPKRFVFDGGACLSAGLWFEMDRPIATVDWTGATVEPDEARYAAPTTIATPVADEVVRPTTANTKMLGSGFDHDGVTPLLVLRSSSPLAVDVFSVADGALLAAEATGVGRIRTPLSFGGGTDIMGGAITNRRYDPRAGVVCHGLIVLLCAVSRQPVPPLSAWNIGATAIVVSQDRGQTWQMVFEDSIVQENRERLREWSMQNWWPTAMGVAPSEAYFVGADYRSKPGCDGGRAYGFRATRSGPGSLWAIETPTRFYETPAVVSGQHAHTTAIFPHNGGVRALVSIGDSQPLNRVVAMDHAGPSISATGWSIDESYHGGIDVAGNQFIGCAPTSELGRILVGADLSDEQIMMLDARGDEPRFTHLFGMPWSNGNGSQNFVLRTPSPERGGPFVCTHDPTQSSEIVPPQARRLLYSDDGMRWAQVFSTENGADWTSVAHGGHLYFDSDGVAKRGWRRVPIPTLRTMSPLEVGPGAMQRLVAEPATTPNTGGTITALTRNVDGLWVDGGVALDPQPPCNGQVWRLTAPGGITPTLIGDITPIASATMGQTTGSARIVSRMWFLNAMDGKTLTTKVELKPSSGASVFTRTTSINATDAWMPFEIAVDAPIPSGQRPILRFRSGKTGSDIEDFYLALDVFAEGRGFPGYACPPDTSGSLTGVALPDEHASVRGIATSSNWTISLAGMLAPNGWGLSTPVGTGERWPLASLVGSGGERLAFYADSVGHLLYADVVRGGSVVGRFVLDEMVWLRNSSLVISVSRAGPGQDLAITVAGCGQAPREMVRESAGTALTLESPVNRVSFDDGTGIDGVGVEIRASSMLWFGGEVLEDEALGGAGRLQRIREMKFLDGNPASARGR